MRKRIRHACQRHIIVEFDKIKGIIHFTAHEKMLIETPEQLACLGKQISKSFKNYYRNRKLFLVMDFNTFVVDLELANQIFSFSQKIFSKYVHSDGIIAYGHSVSRLAFKFNIKKLKENKDHYFNTREEAFAHVDEHLKEKGFDFTQAALKTTPIIIDTIEVSPSVNIPDLQPR